MTEELNRRDARPLIHLGFSHLPCVRRWRTSSRSLSTIGVFGASDSTLSINDLRSPSGMRLMKELVDRRRDEVSTNEARRPPEHVY